MSDKPTMRKAELKACVSLKKAQFEDWQRRNLLPQEEFSVEAANLVTGETCAERSSQTTYSLTDSFLIEVQARLVNHHQPAEPEMRDQRYEEFGGVSPSTGQIIAQNVLDRLHANCGLGDSNQLDGSFQALMYPTEAGDIFLAFVTYQGEQFAASGERLPFNHGEFFIGSVFAIAKNVAERGMNNDADQVSRVVMVNLSDAARWVFERVPKRLRDHEEFCRTVAQGRANDA